MREGRKIIVVFLVMVQFFLGGCVALTGETAGENVDDTVLTSEIKVKLTDERLVNLTRVSVKTERGVVYLTGFVGTPEERNRAVQIAQNVKGVREVVNNLEVRP